jgi:hypothetical protein
VLEIQCVTGKHPSVDDATQLGKGLLSVEEIAPKKAWGFRFASQGKIGGILRIHSLSKREFLVSTSLRVLRARFCRLLLFRFLSQCSGMSCTVNCV